MNADTLKDVALDQAILDRAVIFHPDTIPAELKTGKRFVCWRPEWETAKDGTRKIGKPPVNPRDGSAGSTTNPATWGTFDQARAYARGKRLGIGIVMYDGSGLVGVDIDHCLDEAGNLAPDAQDAVNGLNSYTEVSPSGTGVRLFVKGSLPAGRRKKGPFEAYVSGRHLTLTGRHLPGTPLTVEVRESEIAEFHRKYLDDGKSGNQSTGRGAAAPRAVEAPKPGDMDIIRRIQASKQGSTFEGLWNAKDGGDQSAGDLALCNILAWWTDLDAVAVDRLFRQSGRMREKWDSKRGSSTYGWWTVDRAVAGTKRREPNSVHGQNHSVHNSVQSGKEKNNSFETTVDTQFTENLSTTGNNSVHSVHGFPVPDFSFLSKPEAAALPAFPVDRLPAWIRAQVLAVAEATQTPVDLAACMALGALSVGLARKRRVSVGAQKEPVNLYLAVAMGSGNIKSATLAAMFAPIQQAQRDMEDGHTETVRDVRKQKHQTQHEVDRLKEKKKPRKGEPSALTPEETLQLATKQALLDEFTLPPMPALYVRDVTPEALTSALHENDGRMGCVSDEGAIFSIMGGAYSGRSPVNLQIFLDGWSETDAITKRKGVDLRVRRPALTMAFAVQPSALRDLAKVQDAKEKGLLARFLFSVPESFVGYRNVRALAVPEHVEQAYARALRALVDMPNPEGEEFLYLEPAAENAFYSWRQKLEEAMRLNGALGDMIEAAAKLHGQCLRIAGLLHLAGYWDFENKQREISTETLNNAIEITRYFAQHGRAAYEMMAATSKAAEDSGAGFLLDRITQNYRQDFTGPNILIYFRDLARGVRGRLRTTEAARKAVDVLVKSNLVKLGTERSDRGRPKETVTIRGDLVVRLAEWKAEHPDSIPRSAGQNGQNSVEPTKTPIPSASTSGESVWTELGQAQAINGQNAGNPPVEEVVEEAAKSDRIENPAQQEIAGDSVQPAYGQNSASQARNQAPTILSTQKASKPFIFPASFVVDGQEVGAFSGLPADWPEADLEIDPGVMEQALESGAVWT